MLQEEEKNDDNRNQYNISHPNWKKIQTEAIHPNSDFAGLFLLVVSCLSTVACRRGWSQPYSNQK